MRQWLEIFAACFFITAKATLATAQTSTGPPDVAGWPKIGPDTYIELKIRDLNRNYTVYLGAEEHLKNPNDDRERVSVFKRFLPILPFEEEVGPEERTLGFDIISTRRQNDLIKQLKELRESAEPIAYKRYEVSRDPETGQDIRIDGIKSWILGTRRVNGPWVEGEASFTIEPQSERSKADSKSLIPIGFKYSLGGDYHILRFDQNFLPQPEVKK